ncbi:MAG: STAS domain-containing protein [Acidobacteria bacterium]|nr:STAS domain-containing protein [Acidobacteriota bacterium]
MLHVESAMIGDETRLILRGKVTLVSTPELRNTMLEMINGAPGRITVDLSEVSFLDSSGVAILVEAWKGAQETGKPFVLAKPSAAVMRVLELAQLDQIFDIRRGA